MIDAYVAKGPNPLKLLIFLEEMPMAHRRIWLDLTMGDHRQSDFLALSPSAKVPAIIDRDSPDGQPVRLFESAAILIYLAEKSGKLLPSEARARADTLKWLIWQAATFGPMSGQAGHFLMYAPREGNEYARRRYTDENDRLYAAFDRNLLGREYIAGEYSIADIALFPWISMHRFTNIDLSRFPHVQSWMERVKERPAVQAALAILRTEAPIKRGSPEEFRKNLFHDHCDDSADATVR